MLVMAIAAVGTLLAGVAKTSGSDSQALLYTVRRDQAVELRAISPAGTDARTMATLGDRFIYDVTLSPNGKAVAECGGSEGLSVIDLRDGSKRAVAPCRDYAWAPDSSRIAYADGVNTQIFVVRADGSARTQLTHTRRPKRTWSTYNGLEWAPDGTRIAFMKWQEYDSRHPPVASRIAVVTMSGKQALLARVRPFVPGSLAWSPNSKAVAAGGFRDAGVMIVSLGRAKPQYLRRTNCCIGVIPSWAPAKKWLAFLDGDTSEGDAGGVIELASKRLRVFRQFTSAYDPVWARDSRHFAFVGCRNRNCDVYISNSNGLNVKRVAGTRDVTDLLAWTD